jgi:hypothetical protein
MDPKKERKLEFRACAVPKIFVNATKPFARVSQKSLHSDG